MNLHCTEKKTFFVFLLILVFASCSSVPRIEKRHYREGFYIASHKEYIPVFNKKDSVFPKTKTIPAKNNAAERIVLKTKSISIPVIKTDLTIKKNVLIHKKEKRITESKAIVLPKKEPINKKARTAVVLLIIAKLLLGISFLALLLSWLNIFLLLSGLAALITILAIIFACWAKKIIAKETGINKELGEKEAKFVLERGVGGLVVYAFIILLAILVNAIQKARGK